MFALKFCQAAGARVILSSSSDEKLAKMQEQYPNPPILTVNYTNSNWHEEVLRLTEGNGVDITVENGGTSSLVQSIKCTRRGGIVSQVGYLGKQDPYELEELIPTIIDRRTILRYGVLMLCSTLCIQTNTFSQGHQCRLEARHGGSLPCHFRQQNAT